jgi:hypothetical protein
MFTQMSLGLFIYLGMHVQQQAAHLIYLEKIF